MSAIRCAAFPMTRALIAPHVGGGGLSISLARMRLLGWSDTARWRMIRPPLPDIPGSEKLPTSLTTY